MDNIIITGAANGIGKAALESLNRDLFQNIILVDIAPIEADYPNTHILKCDVSKEEEVAGLFEKIQKLGIKLTHAVNAAGMPGPNKPLISSTIEEFDQVMAVNLRGTLLMMKHQIPMMLENKQGKILNIASVLASCGMSGSSFYAASKAGIVALTKSLAIEYAEKNIQINCLSPGGVDTNFLSKLKKRVGEENIGKMHPNKRLAKAEDIATFIKFIMESETSFMTGSEIFIDGGYSAQ